MSNNQASSDILLERKGPALWATINREERRNALTKDVFAGLMKSLQMAEEDRSIRAVVWTAVGDKAFCAGGDLKPGKSVFDFEPHEPTTTPVNAMRTVTNSRVPIIGRINGHCLAGGLGLLAMCDIAISTDAARFGVPEVRIGLFPMQIYPMLQEIVPRRALTEMCMTGQPITAAKALEYGLLNHVVPASELDNKVNELVTQLTEASPTALRLGKYAMRAMASMTLEQALAFSESQIKVMVQTEDAIEGKASFNEKRKPVWTGR